MKKLYLAFAMILATSTLVYSQSLLSVTPDSIGEGTSLIITITGTGTHFMSASGTLVWINQGTTTVNATSVNPYTETILVANISLSGTEPYGQYNVNVVNSIDGLVTLANAFTVVNTTGINDIANTIRMDVYPNPASDYIRINAELPEYSHVIISVINLSGETIVSYDKRNVKSVAERVEMEGLSTGVYYVIVRVNDTIYTRKVLKN